MKTKKISVCGGNIKTKLSVFFSCIAFLFFMGNYFAQAQIDSDAFSEGATEKDAIAAQKTLNESKILEGGACGENNAGTCVKATFSCPDGQEFVSGGSKNCDGLNLRCCKKSSSSDTKKTGSSSSKEDPLKGAEESQSTGSSSVQPLGKIDIPENLGLPNNTVKGVLNNVLTWLLGIIGILGLAGFVISGIQYLLASGSEGLVETAKRNMTFSAVGIVVALSGFIIIQAINLALSGTPWF